MVTIASNYRGGGGEIDLILLDGDTLVFAEVRLRRNRRFGTAAHSVDARKQVRLLNAARAYLREHDAASRHPCRFDVIAYNDRPDATDTPLWIRGAFDGTGQTF